MLGNFCVMLLDQNGRYLSSSSLVLSLQLSSIHCAVTIRGILDHLDISFRSCLTLLCRVLLSTIICVMFSSSFNVVAIVAPAKAAVVIVDVMASGEGDDSWRLVGLSLGGSSGGWWSK